MIFGIPHKSDVDVESDQLFVLLLVPPIFEKACCVLDGLKLHVDDDKLISLGDVLELLPKRSDSLAALIESGLRATEPGVMLGSSSTFFI